MHNAPEATMQGGHADGLNTACFPGSKHPSSKDLKGQDVVVREISLSKAVDDFVCAARILYVTTLARMLIITMGWYGDRER